MQTIRLYIQQDDMGLAAIQYLLDHLSIPLPNTERRWLRDDQAWFITPLTFSKELDGDALRSEPLIYCHFAKGVGESRYLAVSSWESLNQILEEALESYNELNAIMNLVLFEDAMQHVYVKDISLIRVSHKRVCCCVCALLNNLW